MRRSDIEVPNLPVDVAFCNHLQRRLYLYLFRDTWRVMVAINLPLPAALPSLAFREKSLQGETYDIFGRNVQT